MKIQHLHTISDNLPMTRFYEFRLATIISCSSKAQAQHGTGTKKWQICANIENLIKHAAAEWDFGGVVWRLDPTPGLAPPRLETRESGLGKKSCSDSLV